MSTEPKQTEASTTEQAANLPADDGMSFLDEQPAQVGSQQDNSGALYPNTSRKKESHPNCRGRSLIGGVWYWVSGWNNIMPSGTSRYISLAYTEMTAEDVAKYITNRPAKATTPAEQKPDVPQGTPVETQTDAQANKEALGEGEKSGDEIF